MLTDLTLSAPHPGFCDPRLCSIRTDRGDGLAPLLVHAVTLYADRWRSVELIQSVVLAEDLAHAVRTCRPMVMCEGGFTSGLDAETASRIGEALVLGAQLAAAALPVTAGAR